MRIQRIHGHVRRGMVHKRWSRLQQRGCSALGVNASNYSPGMMLSSPLAPALAHRRTSSLNNHFSTMQVPQATPFRAHCIAVVQRNKDRVLM